MPEIIKVNSLIPESYQILAREARAKRINIFGFKVKPPKTSPCSKSQLFFFRFPRYSDKSVINLSEAIGAFGVTSAYDIAKQAHRQIWQVLPEGASGNFVVCVDPNTVRIESDNCIVANGNKSYVRDVVLKGSNSSIVVDSEGLRSDFSPESAFVRTSSSEFEKSGKTSSIKSRGLTVRSSGKSRFSKCVELCVTESPESAFHRVHNTEVQGSPNFEGKRLSGVIVVDSKGSFLEGCKDLTLQGSEGARLTDCTNLEQVELSPHIRIARTHSLAKISKLPNRQIEEGKVLPAGFLERLPFVGKYLIPTLSA